MSDRKPSISVIIPTYNYARYLQRAIDSALTQIYTPHEIIVVDDGSTDDTRQVARGFGDRVKYIFQENAGISAARNNGLQVATGDWAAFLDADDWWLPEKLQLQIDAAHRNPKAVLVYTGAWKITPDGARTLQPAADLRNLWPTLRFSNCVSGGSSAMIRRDVLLAEGGFDQSLQACEDWDMWIRLARKHEFAVVPEPVTVIAVWPQSVSGDPERMLFNMEKIIEKSLVSDLTGLRRTLWRRRIRGAQLFGAAISARGLGPSEERNFLFRSLRQWPLPAFLPKRWVSLALNLLRPPADIASGARS